MRDEQLKFEAVVDDLAAYLALAAERKGGGGISLSHYSGIEIFLPGMTSVVQAKHGDQAVIAMDVGVGDVRAFDLSAMQQATDAPGALFALSRFRRLSSKQVRGQVNFLAPYIIEDTSAIIWRDGRVLRGHSAIWGSADGLTGWRCIGPRHVNAYGLRMEDQVLVNLRLSLGVHFLRDYDWNVHLGYAGYPTINFPTDPTGVLEVFRLRDIPEGKTRRAALLHWVKEHWRKKRSDPNALTRVKAHMRGQTSFTWNNLSCTIKPSAHDLRLLKGVC